jgi:hypothetical protein
MDKESAAVQKFLHKVFGLLTSDITLQMFSCTYVQEYCINLKSKDVNKPYEIVPTPVNQQFKYKEEDSNEEEGKCLALPLVEGKLDCKFWLKVHTHTLTM